MAELLELELTLFLLIAVGALVKKLGITGDGTQRGLTELVIDLVLPCNIVTSFLNGADADTLRGCLAVAVISLGVQLLCVAWGRLVYRNEKNADRKVCLEYGIICSNAGFLGNPVAEGIYGSTGLMYASVYLIPLRIMMWSEGLASFSGETDWRKTLKKVVTHPCIIACVLGLFLMLTGLSLPGFLYTAVQTIGRCNTALCMLVIGMILADIDLRTVIDRDVLLYTLQRLVLIPLVIYLLLLLIPTDSTVRGLSVVLAAMPAGTTTSMLAAKYNRDAAFGTKLVVFSTLCSIPAILAWSLILNG